MKRTQTARAPFGSMGDAIDAWEVRKDYSVSPIKLWREDTSDSDMAHDFALTVRGKCVTLDIDGAECFTSRRQAVDEAAQRAHAVSEKAHDAANMAEGNYLRAHAARLHYRGTT